MWGRQTNVAPELVPDPYNLTKKKNNNNNNNNNNNRPFGSLCTLVRGDLGGPRGPTQPMGTVICLAVSIH